MRTRHISANHPKRVKLGVRTQQHDELQHHVLRAAQHSLSASSTDNNMPATETRTQATSDFTAVAAGRLA